MKLPHSDRSMRRFQSAVLWIRFTETLADSGLAFSVFCDLVQKLVVTLELGGIVLEEGGDVVLALEGTEAGIDEALKVLRASRYVDIVTPWRLRIDSPRFRPSVLARPTLTPAERVWLRMEIEAGFTDLGTLPTLLEWLALRQVHSASSLRAEALVDKRLSTDRKATAKILPFPRPA